MLYNFPDRTNVSLSANLVRKLAKDCPAIVGIKDTVDNISHTREIIAAVKPVRSDFSVLSGFDEYMIPNLMAGGDGILTGLTNVAPDLFVSMLKAWKQGDIEELRRGQKRVNLLMQLYGITKPFISAIKCAMEMIVPGTPACLRAPFGPVEERQRQAIKLLLEQAGVL
jgi:4-hydroxy-tetrahydrodipicolinate synthase